MSAPVAAAAGAIAGVRAAQERRKRIIDKFEKIFPDENERKVAHWMSDRILDLKGETGALIMIILFALGMPTLFLFCLLGDEISDLLGVAGSAGEYIAIATTFFGLIVYGILCFWADNFETRKNKRELKNFIGEDLLKKRIKEKAEKALVELGYLRLKT